MMTRDQALAIAYARWGVNSDCDENHSAGVSLYVVGVFMKGIKAFVALGCGPSYEDAFERANEDMYEAIR